METSINDVRVKSGTVDKKDVLQETIKKKSFIGDAVHQIEDYKDYYMRVK